MDRAQEVAKHFKFIKKLHDWCKAHPGAEHQEEFNRIDEKLEKDTYPALISLGVDPEFGKALFIFGPDFTDSLVKEPIS